MKETLAGILSILYSHDKEYLTMDLHTISKETLIKSTTRSCERDLSCLRTILDRNLNTRDLFVQAELLVSRWPAHIRELMAAYSKRFELHTKARHLIDKLPTRAARNKRKLARFEEQNTLEQHKKQRREAAQQDDHNARVAIQTMGLAVQSTAPNKNLTVKQLKEKLQELLDKVKEIGGQTYQQVREMFKGRSKLRRTELVQLLRKCCALPELACGIIEEVGEEDATAYQEEEIEEAEVVEDDSTSSSDTTDAIDITSAISILANMYVINHHKHQQQAQHPQHLTTTLKHTSACSASSKTNFPY